MSLYGKHFASMYEGSLVGKGAVAFALMGYVIANMKCQWTGEGRAKVVTEGTVRLNATVLSAILGETEEVVREGIEFLCQPDKNSQSKSEQGRRLVRIGEFEYRVVNAPHYQNIKDKDDQREKNRVRQQEYRVRNKLSRTKAEIRSSNLAGEAAYEKAVEDGASDLEAMKRAEAAMGAQRESLPQSNGAVQDPPKPRVVSPFE